jgi:predicted Zn-dependent peptidase
MRSGGSYAVQGSFRTEVVVDAIREARRLLDISGAPFTAAEVEGAISYFTGVSPLRYATADGIADQAATQVLADLPDDYVDRNLAELRAVTPGSATDAYRSAVQLDDTSLVVVGHADRLADGLRELGYDVEVVAADRS